MSEIVYNITVPVTVCVSMQYSFSAESRMYFVTPDI